MVGDKVDVSKLFNLGFILKLWVDFLEFGCDVLDFIFNDFVKIVASDRENILCRDFGFKVDILIFVDLDDNIVK